MRSTLSALVVSMLFAACAEPEPPGEALAGVFPFESPAGEGSEEPHLSTWKDQVLLSWLAPDPEDRWSLRFSSFSGGEWSDPVTVATAADAPFFVNWADFPSVVPGADGTLWAHWLQRREEGGYAYGIRISRSVDSGRTWSEPWTPHEDGTPTEHGFLSFFPVGDEMGMIWLDGRKYAPGADGSPPTKEMTLMFRTAAADGTAGSEVAVDDRICDCCITDAVVTSEGPVVAYRNRTEAEIRDIYVTRLVDGAWTEGRPVHDDGWEIGGCPVNGPALAGEGRDVAVAWFTGAGGQARVKVAFSSDAGATFGPPVVVDGGNPGGRVDLVRLEDGSVLVSWMERVGEGEAEIRVRRVSPEGAVSEHSVVARTSAARNTGFPQMVLAPTGDVLFAWTDATGDGHTVRMTRAELADR